MTPSRKLLVVTSAVAALCLGSGFAAGTLVRSPAQVAADADPPAPNVLTSPVTTGSVTRAIVVRGTVTRGSSVSVDAGTAEGTDAVVTRRPLALGQSVRAGMVLAEVSYRPVIALGGRVPMIRDLTVGSTGPDVAALQEAVRALGWAIYDSPGVFGSSTSAALTEVYESVGYEVPTRLVAAPAAPQASVSRSSADQDAARPVAQVVAKKSELAMIGGLPGTVTAMDGRVGATAGEGVVTISTAPATVRTSIAPSQRSLVEVGDPVSLSSASPQYRSRARVTQVGAAVQDQETGAYSVPLTITPAKPLPDGVLEKGLEVRIDVEKAADQGLIVPVAAVWTTADGSTSVSKVVDGRTVEVEVTVLETGNGRARVTAGSGDLATGDPVRVGVAS